MVEHMKPAINSIFHLIAEHSPNMVFVNKMGRLIYVNQKCVEVMGYSKEEFLSPDFDFMRLIAPEHHDIIKNNMAKHMKGENLLPYEYDIITKDGKRLNTFISSKLVKWEGEFAILGIVTDITILKNIEEKLHHSEEKFRLAFQTSPDSININRLSDGLYVDCNQGFCNLTGYKRDEVIGKTSLEIDIWKYPEDRKEMVRQIREKGSISNFEADFRMKDGSIKAGLMSAAVIMIQNTPHVVNITKDITFFKQAVSAMISSEERFRTIFNGGSDAIYIHDLKGKIIETNIRAEEMTGYKSSELERMNIVDLEKDGKKDSIVKLDESLRKKGKRYLRTEYKKKDGSLFHVDINSRYVIIEGNEICISVVRDLTPKIEEKKKLKREEERFRELFNNLSTSFLVLEPKEKNNDMIIKDMNVSAQHNSSIEKDNIGNSFYKVFPNMKGEKYQEMIRKILSSETPVHINNFYYNTSEGEYWYDLSTYRLSTGELVVLYNDITDKQISQKKLMEHRTFLENVINSTSDIIISIDKDGNVITWNKAMKNLSGYRFWEVVNTKLCETECFKENEKIRERCFETGEESITLHAKTKNGKDLAVDFMISRLKDDEGKVSGILFFGKNITDLSKLENIDEGTCYMVKDSERYRTIKQIKKDMLYRKCIFLSRDDPLDAGIFIKGKNFEFKHLSKYNLDGIRKQIEKSNNNLFVLKRIDYLITLYGITEFLKFLYTVVDTIKKKQSSLMVCVDDELLDRKYYLLIKQELKQFKSTEPVEELDPELLEIIKLIHQRRFSNKTTSYSDVINILGSTTTTTRKRIATLKDKGYIDVKKKGRKKLIYLDEKAKIIF